MTLEDFEDTLRQFIRREPFQPFVVDMQDGRRIEVLQPAVAFGGGAASYITPAYDVVEFACEDVTSIQQAAHEAAS